MFRHSSISCGFFCSQVLLALIHDIVDWRAYHNKECNNHDCCGALQSCGGGEDVQHLLNALDASLDPPRATADSGRAMEPMHSIDMDNSNPSLETEQNHGDTVCLIAHFALH